MKKLLLFLCFYCFYVVVYAQQLTITGKVTDNKKEPLIGVSISEKGTTNGTITSLDGSFSLNVGTGSTLVFSYIGYKTQEIVPGGRTFIDVVLQEDAEQLEEVVVVGYGVQKNLV